MPGPTLRAIAAMALVGLWMALLFAGHPLHGLTHLLLLAAAVLFPWKAARPSSRPRAAAPPAGMPARSTDPTRKNVRSAGAPPAHRSHRPPSGDEVRSAGAPPRQP